MPVKLTNIRRPVDEPEALLIETVVERLDLQPDEIRSWRILRKSLDARQRHSLEFVYSLVVETMGEENRLEKWLQNADIHSFQPKQFVDPPPGNDSLSQQPVIVGSGPAGLLAGYYLAWKGYRPIILERGQPVKERVPAIRRFDKGGEFEQENNYLFWRRRSRLLQRRETHLPYERARCGLGTRTVCGVWRERIADL